MSHARAILFGAFEPSGDAIAAPLIEQLRAERPQWRIYAFGGPKMAAAGAELLEQTTDNAMMLAGAVRQAMVHRQRMRKAQQWLGERRIAAFIPTDSPAANWGICRSVRRQQPGAKIVHLVAPQLWAWAAWRIRKLRRLSDHVLCLLPFEPDWFQTRGVNATFVGHPLFAEAFEKAHEPDTTLPQGHPRLALLPGSRSSEVKANWPTMVRVWDALRQQAPGLETCVAASDTSRAELLAELTRAAGVAEQAIAVRTQDASGVLDWADAALVVSGTATLHAASRRTPLVSLYYVNPLIWHLAGRWLVQTRTFTLPNLIGQWLGFGRVTPEFVPHHGATQPVIDALRPLLADGPERRSQLEAFASIAACFRETDFAERACAALVDVVEG